MEHTSQVTEKNSNNAPPSVGHAPRITSLITLYNPKEENFRNIEILSEQTDRVIVCDNSAVDNSARISPANAVYMSECKNLGLPEAFNLALRDASLGWEPDELVIFFDQDSEITEGYISSLADELRKAESVSPQVGCIGPVYYDKSSESLCVPKMKNPLTDGIYSVGSIITSSMMCRYATLRKIGFWNEKLFLDLADWDVCWRMQQAGYLSCLTENVTLIHTLGEGSKKIGPIKLKVGSPIREYYQTRDCLLLLHEKYTPLKYKLRFIAMLTVRPLLHIMFLDDKKKRRYYISRGIRDHRAGVTGEFENEPR